MDSFLLIKVLNKLLVVEGSFTSLLREVSSMQNELDNLSATLAEISEQLSDAVSKIDLNSLKNETQIFF